LEHALRPHRRKYYLQITDPDFFPKMDHIIGCYVHPPEHLYCFDECTCIQALNRITPTLPAAAHQPALEDFDYQRNGTTDLLAFLNPATGRVYGQVTDNHDRHTLCRVFSSHVRMHPAGAVLHYIMDNLSAHYHDDFCRTVAKLSGVPHLSLKTGAERRQWLQSPHKRIVVHFVPFHASWLNMVEIWFGILKKKCLNYDHFTSVRTLREAILAFIDTWNDFYAHPFTWSYTGEGLHRKAVRRFCLLLSIETPQMDCKFLARQLLLMSNIAENYLEFIPEADWLRLIELATEKQQYMTNIIQSDSGPKRQRQALEAYTRFVGSVLSGSQPLVRAA
jgi:transposase